MLKVHEVVALFEDGHGLDALLPLFLVGVKLLLLVFDRLHVHLAQMVLLVKVLVEGVGRVDGVEFLGGVSAGILEDDLGASRVLWQELGDIVCAPVDNDPAGIFGVVGGNLLASELDPLSVVAVVIHGSRWMRRHLEGNGRKEGRRGTRINWGNGWPAAVCRCARRH